MEEKANGVNELEEEKQQAPVNKCEYKLVKSKRRGQQCHRTSTKTWDGSKYCLYHYRMISTRELPPQPKSENKESSLGGVEVRQLQFPKDSLTDMDATNDLVPPKKRKRPVYNDDPSSDTSSDDDDADNVMDFGRVWNNNYIDFDALERMCLDSFHRNSRMSK